MDRALVSGTKGRGFDPRVALQVKSMTYDEYEPPSLILFFGFQPYFQPQARIQPFPPAFKNGKAQGKHADEIRSRPGSENLPKKYTKVPAMANRRKYTYGTMYVDRVP